MAERDAFSRIRGKSAMNATPGRFCSRALSGDCPFYDAHRQTGICGPGCRPQILLRGTYLFDQGEECHGLFAVLKGTLALDYVDDSGAIAILRLARSGDLLACADLFAGHEHKTSARVIDDAVVCPLPESIVLKAMAGDPAMALSLLRATAGETQAFSRFAQRMSGLGVDSRVLSLIEELSGGRRHFVLPVSKKDLAFMAGTGPEVLSRTLVKLQKTGALWMEGNAVTILDPALDGASSRLAC
jgi:CRP-like cAMP-binding protein